MYAEIEATIKRKKILIVDDDKQFMNDLVFLLGDSFRFTQASGSREGMERLRKEKFDLVLLDLKMPAYFAAAEDEEGIELLRIIRRGQEKEREEKLPVIILTKTDNPENRRLCRQLEANLFLSKPPDAGELKKQIRHLISNT